MNILRISSSFPPRSEIGKHAGLEPNVYHLSKLQAGSGHDVLVIAPGNPPGITEVGGFRVIRLGTIRMARWILGLKSVITSNRLGFDPQIIHGLNPMTMGWLLRASRRLTRAKFVFSIHGSYRDSSAEFRELVLHIADAADRTVVLSPFLVRYLVQDGIRRDSIRMIPSGVDVDLFQETPLPEKTGILYAGSFRGVKRVGLIVRAFSEVVLDNPEARLILAGGSPGDSDYGEVMRMIRGLRLEDRIELVDPVNHFRIPEVFKRSLMVVLGSKIEGLGKVLLEAGATGRPSIAPRVGGIPSVIRHGVNGLLYRGNSLSGMVSCMERIIECPYEAMRMGRLARRVVEDNFSWQYVSERYTGVFQSLLEE